MPEGLSNLWNTQITKNDPNLMHFHDPAYRNTSSFLNKQGKKRYHQCYGTLVHSAWIKSSTVCTTYYHVSSPLLWHDIPECLPLIRCYPWMSYFFIKLPHQKLAYCLTSCPKNRYFPQISWFSYQFCRGQSWISKYINCKCNFSPYLHYIPMCVFISLSLCAKWMVTWSKVHPPN